ncbi:MAG: 2-C-methyl-D-erythritol 4-phosphate cytidylyltransferase [Acidimicrobiales bacterium]
MTVWAVIVAAGASSRFGRPKAYALLGGRRVVEWSVAAARAIGCGVVLVVPPERAGDPEPEVDAVVGGGPTRSESVRRGLASVPADAETVVVHDAARPLAPASLFAAVVDAIWAGADGAVPGIPLPDTVKRVGPDGAVVETLDRDQLVAVQTPQGFVASVLRSAHVEGLDATDDAGLVERAGGRVVVVPGEERNQKLTRPGDLVVAEARLSDPGGW